MTYCSMNLESLTKEAQAPKVFVVESCHVAAAHILATTNIVVQKSQSSTKF